MPTLVPSICLVITVSHQGDHETVRQIRGVREGRLFQGHQKVSSATKDCRSPNGTSNKEPKVPNFTGYRLQVTLRWQGLVRPELHCQKQGTEGSGRKQFEGRSIAPILSSFCFLCRSRFSPQPRPVHERVHCRIVHGT